MDNYFGKYVRGFAVNSEQAAKLMNADNIIGDIYKVKCEMVNGKHRAVVLNRFGETPVFFDSETSREIAINQAKGFLTYAILTLVGFTTKHSEEEEDSSENYWAEFAVISFPDLEKEAFTRFVEIISKSVKKNRRPEVALSEEDIKKVISSNGDFLPVATHPKPEKVKGQVLMKSRVSLTEMMVEEGRKKNPGCYIFGWLFLLVFVALFILLIKTILGL